MVVFIAGLCLLIRAALRRTLNENSENVDSFFAKAEEGKEVLRLSAVISSKCHATYLINSVRLVIVYDANLASIRERDHLCILDVHHVLDW